MLNLSNNKICEIECVNHLEKLVFLDLSFNLIETCDHAKELPRNIQIMRMNENPLA